LRPYNYGNLLQIRSHQLHNDPKVQLPMNISTHRHTKDNGLTGSKPSDRCCHLRFADYCSFRGSVRRNESPI